MQHETSNRDAAPADPALPPLPRGWKLERLADGAARLVLPPAPAWYRVFVVLLVAVVLGIFWWSLAHSAVAGEWWTSPARFLVIAVGTCGLLVVALRGVIGRDEWRLGPGRIEIIKSMGPARWSERYTSGTVTLVNEDGDWLLGISAADGSVTVLRDASSTAEAQELRSLAEIVSGETGWRMRVQPEPPAGSDGRS